jgi:hypothetical protein
MLITQIALSSRKEKSETPFPTKHFEMETKNVSRHTEYIRGLFVRSFPRRNVL